MMNYIIEVEKVRQKQIGEKKERKTVGEKDQTIKNLHL